MKRNINLVGLVMLCILLISTTVFASPKSDLQEIWDKQTFGNARYHVTMDTKMALFGKIQNSNIIDVKRKPLFVRSEDSMTMFGKTRTTTSYLVEDGNKLFAYTEEAKYTESGIETEWVRYEDELPTISDEEMSDLLLPFDKFVRSVKLLSKEEDGRMYHVTLDGRTFYKSMKKLYGKETAAPLEGETTAEKEKREMIHSFAKELLKTWKDTEAVTMMVMVKGDKIVGMQTELAPQFNALVHIGAEAFNAGQKQDESGMNVGALAEAFLQTESMKLTIIEVGEAEYSAVPEEIVKTAIAKGSVTEMRKAASVLQGEKSTESTSEK